MFGISNQCIGTCEEHPVGCVTEMFPARYRRDIDTHHLHSVSLANDAATMPRAHIRYAAVRHYAQIFYNSHDASNTTSVGGPF